jgi:peptide/nickel transport system permease protein
MSTPIEAATAPGAATEATPRRGLRSTLAALAQVSGVGRAMLFVGAGLMLLFIVMAIFAPLIAPYGFNDDSANGKDFVALQAPSGQHWFGTTVGGEDVLSRVVFGARTGLEVVIVAVVLAIVIGVPLGLVSGYLGGWLDRVLVLISDALFAFPPLLLAIVISIAVSGGSSSERGGVLAAGISIMVIYVPQYFRVVRNATISVREEPYVEAARGLGAAPFAIMRRYVFSNVIQSVPIIATVNAGDAILTLAGLGFLGFGIPPSAAAEWGYDLNKALADTAAGIWWTGVFPGVAIVLLVLGASLAGESLNDVLNPLLRARRLGTVVMPSRRPRAARPISATPEQASRDVILENKAVDGAPPHSRPGNPGPEEQR